MARKQATRKVAGDGKWKAAPYNPRAIGPEALAGLRTSLETFGDLSGIVVNRRTGHIVCGHQRLQALGDVDLGRIRWEPGSERQVELGNPSKRFSSRERFGMLTGPGGALFRVCEVDWPESFERAANVMANSHAIAGTWTAAAEALIDEIRTGMPDLANALLLDALLKEIPRAAAELDAMPQLAGLEYRVIVDCKDEDQQRALLERFEKQGLSCRALTS